MASAVKTFQNTGLVEGIHHHNNHINAIAHIAIVDGSIDNLTYNMIPSNIGSSVEEHLLINNKQVRVHRDTLLHRPLLDIPIFSALTLPPVNDHHNNTLTSYPYPDDLNNVNGFYDRQE